MPDPVFIPLTEEQKEHYRKLFDREDDDPVFEFYKVTGSEEEDDDERPGDRHNLQYAP